MMKNQKQIIDAAKKYFVPAVVVVAAIFALRYVLQLLGIIDSSSETAKKNDFGNSVGSAQDKLAAGGMSLSQPPAYWLTVANAIYEDLKYSAVSDNKSDAVHQFTKLNNDLDLWSLIEKFGFRQEYAFGIPIGDEKDLASFISSNMSDSKVGEINAHLKAKAISYRF